MTKAIHAVLVLALACLFALSAALPSMLSQSVSARTKFNVPRTLLGKPYRGRCDPQGCPLSCWTLTVTDRKDADPRADPDHASAHVETQIWSGDYSQKNMNTIPLVPIPLPLVLNTFSESGRARLRLVRSKRPMQHSPYTDDPPPSEKPYPDGMHPRDGVELLQSPDVSGPERKQGLREGSVPVRSSRRLYDRGEWKSRLHEEYDG